MNYLQNEEQFLRIATFLGTVKEKAARNGSALLANLRPADAKITPNELFVHAPISGGGTQHLLTGSSVQEKGVTNFDGNRLGQGRNFVADAITVQYGEAASGTNVYNVEFKDELPNVLQSSNIVVRQNNEVVIKLPIRSIQNAKKTDAFYRKLEALALLVDLQEIEISIELPSGSTITPKTSGHETFVAVYIKGFETYIKR